jgi:hypothetical protein
MQRGIAFPSEALRYFLKGQQPAPPLRLNPARVGCLPAQNRQARQLNCRISGSRDLDRGRHRGAGRRLELQLHQAPGAIPTISRNSSASGDRPSLLIQMRPGRRPRQPRIISAESGQWRPCRTQLCPYAPHDLTQILGLASERIGVSPPARPSLIEERVCPRPWHSRVGQHLDPEAVARNQLVDFSVEMAAAADPPP